MDAELLEAKNTLRASMREQLAALPPHERAVHSQQLVEKLIELPAWIASTRVLLFAPLPSEPDLDLLWFGTELAGNLDLVLVPGLAFDAAGGRLGRGGGFYDRLLATRDPERTRLVGVGFTFQLLAEELPHAAHDVRLDGLITA